MTRLLIALALLVLPFPASAQESQYSEGTRNFFASPDIEWPENDGIVRRVGLNGIEVFGGAVYLLESDEFRLRSLKVSRFERRVTVIYDEVIQTGQSYQTGSINCMIVVEAIPMSEPWDHDQFVRTMRSEIAAGSSEPQISQSDWVSTFSAEGKVSVREQERIVMSKFALARLPIGQQLLARRNCFSANDTAAKIEEHSALRPGIRQDSAYFEQMAERYQEHLSGFAEVERLQVESNAMVADLRSSCFGSSPLFAERSSMVQRFDREKPYLNFEDFAAFYAQLSRIDGEIVELTQSGQCP